MSEPGAGPLETLARDLRDDPLALPFARAVFTQLARAPGAYSDSHTHDIDALALRISALLRSAASGGSSMGDSLMAEPIMAAAFFQNVDLLYDSSFPRADAVSSAIMQALEGLSAEAG